jgi:hypothetical protein
MNISTLSSCTCPVIGSSRLTNRFLLLHYFTIHKCCMSLPSTNSEWTHYLHILLVQCCHYQTFFKDPSLPQPLQLPETWGGGKRERGFRILLPLFPCILSYTKFFYGFCSLAWMEFIITSIFSWLVLIVAFGSSWPLFIAASSFSWLTFLSFHLNFGSYLFLVSHYHGLLLLLASSHLCLAVFIVATKFTWLAWLRFPSTLDRLACWLERLAVFPCWPSLPPNFAYFVQQAFFLSLDPF